MTEVLDRPYTYYEQLGVSLEATQQEIAAAYARYQAEWLAFAKRGDRGALVQLRDLAEAYATLADPARRVAYDRMLDDRHDRSSTGLLPSDAKIVVPSRPATPVLSYVCPRCGALNPIQLATCEACGHQGTRPCPICRTLVPLAESMCPKCDTAIDDHNRRRFEEAEHSAQPIEADRQAAAAQVRGQGTMNRLWGRQVVALWAAVALGCAALVALAWFVVY